MTSYSLERKKLDKLSKKRELEGSQDMTMLTEGIADYQKLRDLNRERPNTEIFLRDSADLIKRLTIFGKDTNTFTFNIGISFFQIFFIVKNNHSDDFFDSVIELNGYDVRSRDFWKHMSQLQNINELRCEWVSKWTVCNALKL